MLYRVERFSIERAYAVPCKLFMPVGGIVKRVVLGVHGFAGDKESSVLSRLATELSGAHTALICFDFPAHGESAQDEVSLTVADCTADLLAVAKWMREQYPHAEKAVFATSFGGYIALLCAEALPEFTLILRAPAIRMPQVLLEAILHTTPEVFAAVKTMSCGFERSITLPYRFYEELAANDPFIAEYTQPMLIIHGDKDDVVPHADSVAFCNRHNHASLVTVRGADHRFKKDGEVEEIIRAACSFLDKKRY